MWSARSGITGKQGTTRQGDVTETCTMTKLCVTSSSLRDMAHLLGLRATLPESAEQQIGLVKSKSGGAEKMGELV